MPQGNGIPAPFVLIVTFNTGNCILKAIFVSMTNQIPRSAARCLDSPHTLSLKAARLPLNC